MADLATALNDLKNLNGKFRSLQQVEDALSELVNLEQAKRDLTAQEAGLKAEVEKAREQAAAANAEAAEAEQRRRVAKEEAEDILLIASEEAKARKENAQAEAQKLIADTKAEIAQKHEEAQEAIGAARHVLADVNSAVTMARDEHDEISNKLDALKAQFS